MGAEVSRDLMLDSLRAGTHPMRKITKLDGDISRLLGKDRPLDPHVPLSSLAKELFDHSLTTWVDIAAGR